MNKRIVAVICIFVALSSFFGGVIYEHEEDRTVMEQPVVKYFQKQAEINQQKYEALLQDKYDDFFIMPLDSKTCYIWFDPETYDHKEHIGTDRFMEVEPMELPLKWVNMWIPVNKILLELEVDDE